MRATSPYPAVAVLVLVAVLGAVLHDHPVWRRWETARAEHERLVEHQRFVDERAEFHRLVTDDLVAGRIGLAPSIDLFLSASAQRQGLGTEAIRILARHLIDERGHHRLTIDPAAGNHAAIRAYEKVGFSRVGVMRSYERGPDGTWHDGLLMELLAGELRD